MDILLSFQGYDIFQGNGSVSNAEMEKYARMVYDKFDNRRKLREAEEADAEDLKWLEDLQNRIKDKNKE